MPKLRYKKIRTDQGHRKNQSLGYIFHESRALISRRTWHSFMVCDRRYYSEPMARFLSDPDPVISKSKLLKDGRTSTVAMVIVGGERLVVKRYNIKDLWHAVSRLARPSRAAISWRNAHRLGLFGIHTPKPIALLEKRFGPFRRKAYFITTYIDGNDAYHLIHKQGIRALHRQSTVDRFSEIFQALSKASISHGDCKATNFIMTHNDIFVIDLDAMRERHFHWTLRRALNKDHERFMRNWTDIPEVYNVFHKKLKNMPIGSEMIISNYRFYRRKGYCGYLSRTYANDDTFIDCILTALAGNSKKPSSFEKVGSSVYADVRRFEYQGKIFFLKLFLRRNLRDPAKRILLGSRAFRALRGHEILASYGFNTPRVVLMGEKGPINFIVTESAIYDKTLTQCLIDFEQAEINRAMLINKRRFFRELGREVGLLHRKGISHGDLRCGNVLVKALPSGKYQFQYLDNERTVRYRLLSAHRRLKNLVQLNMVETKLASQTDRMRFFLAYLEENEPLFSKKKYWQRRVIHKTKQRHIKRAKRYGNQEILPP